MSGFSSRSFFRTLLLGWALCTAAGAAALEVGDPAPDFSLSGSDGKQHRLSDYRGRHVVIAWFPKAFTGG
jgi:peroxiredoxin Q/BCP